jgi:hypothetical protein
MKPTLGVLAVAALLSLGQSTRAADSKKPLPDLSGQWSLERDHSLLPPEGTGRDAGRGRPEEGMTEPPRPPMGGDGMGGMGGGMGRRGGMGGMGGMGPGGPRRGAPRLTPEEMAAMRAIMRSVLKPAATLALKNEDDAILVSGEETGTLILRPDGKKVKLDGGGERRTRWRDEQLEEELKAGMVKVKRIYGVTDTERGRRLVIVVRVEDERRGEKEYWYVYQPAAAAGTEPLPSPATEPATAPAQPPEAQ